MHHFHVSKWSRCRGLVAALHVLGFVMQSACVYADLVILQLTGSKTASMLTSHTQQVHDIAVAVRCQVLAETDHAVLQGMLQLHNHNPSILHRDLKSPNLLVDKHWRVKVTDFNLSSMLRSDADTYGVLSSVANNPRWLAPEVHQLFLIIW